MPLHGCQVQIVAAQCHSIFCSHFSIHPSSCRYTGMFEHACTSEIMALQGKLPWGICMTCSFRQRLCTTAGTSVTVSEPYWCRCTISFTVLTLLVETRPWKRSMRQRDSREQAQRQTRGREATIPGMKRVSPAFTPTFKAPEVWSGSDTPAWRAPLRCQLMYAPRLDGVPGIRMKTCITRFFIVLWRTSCTVCIGVGHCFRCAVLADPCLPARDDMNPCGGAAGREAEV